jgi:hypothetical protein
MQSYWTLNRVAIRPKEFKTLLWIPLSAWFTSVYQHVRLCVSHNFLPVLVLAIRHLYTRIAQSKGIVCFRRGPHRLMIVGVIGGGHFLPPRANFVNRSLHVSSPARSWIVLSPVRLITMLYHVIPLPWRVRIAAPHGPWDRWCHEPCVVCGDVTFGFCGKRECSCSFIFVFAPLPVHALQENLLDCFILLVARWPFCRFPSVILEPG